MTELKIENPYSIAEYNQTWADMRNCFMHIVKTFPNENRVVSEDNEAMRIVILKTAAQFNNHDQILFITGSPNDDKISVRYEGSNQLNKVSSFAEQKSLINHVETFKILVQKSLNGTLDQTVARINNNAKQVAQNKQTALGMQAALQITAAVVAIFLIFIGIKGCNS